VISSGCWGSLVMMVGVDCTSSNLLFLGDVCLKLSLMDLEPLLISWIPEMIRLWLECSLFSKDSADLFLMRFYPGLINCIWGRRGVTVALLLLEVGWIVIKFRSVLSIVFYPIVVLGLIVLLWGWLVELLLDSSPKCPQMFLLFSEMFLNLLIVDGETLLEVLGCDEPQQGDEYYGNELTHDELKRR